MPLNFKGNVSSPVQSAKSLEMEVVPATGSDHDRRVLDTDLPRTMTPDNKQREKRSLDYALKSGLAGGLAGCAVSLHDALTLCSAKLTVGSLSRRKPSLALLTE